MFTHSFRRNKLNLPFPALVNLVSSRTRLVCSLNAGSKIHNNLLVNVLRGPTSFFDTTPTGRIVTRFSKDINHIDFSLPDQLGNFCMCIQNAVITILMIINATPEFAYMIVPLGIIYYTLQVIHALPFTHKVLHLFGKVSIRCAPI